MSDRPILFSVAMVRAILAGKKTQTRRLVKDPRRRTPNGVELLTRWTDDDPRAKVRVTDRGAVAVDTCGGVAAPILLSPYGAVGDRLWARETWVKTSTGDVLYRERGDRWPYAWRPSIFMRRTESRITLEVTDVRVERLQSITEADARAEGASLDVGCPCEGDDEDPGPHVPLCRWTRESWPGETPIDVEDPHRMAFAALWDSINAERAAWSENPWVWAVSFRVAP